MSEHPGESAKTSEYVEINDLGRRCGETHHNATLSDHDVELIRTLRLEHRMPLRILAEKFEVSISTICDICKFRRRNQIVTTMRRRDLEK